MKKGRNEVLKTNSEIRILAIRRTIISIVIIDIVIAVLCFMLLQSSMPEKNEIGKVVWQLYRYLIPIMDIIVIFFFYPLAKQEFECKNSKTFVRMYLPQGEAVEVIPIKVELYSDFIFGLTEISKFYATTNKKGDKVEIRVKLNNESKSRYFQQIYSSYFTEYYKIAN